MLHLYYGDGKGKTTAAMGLVMRHVGAGKKVQVIQFLKDGTSSEIEVLKKMGVSLTTQKMPQKFIDMQDPIMVKEFSKIQDQLFDCIDFDCDLIVLDEILDAMQLYLLNEGKVYDIVKELEKHHEVVMTGRMPCQKLKQLSSYSTQMKKQKHPYDNGIQARKGIEY